MAGPLCNRDLKQDQGWQLASWQQACREGGHRGLVQSSPAGRSAEQGPLTLRARPRGRAAAGSCPSTRGGQLQKAAQTAGCPGQPGPGAVLSPGGTRHTAQCHHGARSVLSASRPPGSSYFRYAESSMKNSFGLKYLHKFFNIPFLQLQVSLPAGGDMFLHVLWHRAPGS